MSNTNTDRVWFITGASTGFGRVLAEEVLKGGGRVVATARKLAQVEDLERQYPERARALRLDVTKPDEVEQSVASAIAAFGRIDVLVNNAGYGLAGAIEEVVEAEFEPMFETNLFGLLRVTKAVLPHLRTQGSGHILNLSSIGGLIGGSGIGYYNASKFAVEGLSEALAAELAPLGIRVTVIEPGPFRTDFLGRSGVIAKQELAEYKETAGKMRAYFSEQSGKQKGDPVRAAHAMMNVVAAETPPVHLLLGASALTRFRSKLEQWQKDLAAWESVTTGADFPEGE